VTFEGPEPNDIFFGIVQRGRAMIMFKAVDVEPVPNYTRDIGHGIASWDAYIYVPDPDALYAEFASRNVDFRGSALQQFRQPARVRGEGHQRIYPVLWSS
jgi:predicted RNase H-like nuclease (RuvC/YqgF family)